MHFFATPFVECMVVSVLPAIAVTVVPDWHLFFLASPSPVVAVLSESRFNGIPLGARMYMYYIRLLIIVSENVD